MLNTSYFDGNKKTHATLMPNKSDAYFNSNSGDKKSFMEKTLRIKSANTSKYAKNHL